MTRSIATIILTSLSMVLVAAAPSTPSPPATAEAVELVLLAGDRPMRVALFVEIDGRPVNERWDVAFDHLLAFGDTNGDGVLSQAEAARLPSAFGVRQVLWGQVNPQSGTPPPFQELDANGDNTVTRAELAAWYRRAGIGGVTIGGGTVPNPETLTDALVKALDADGNGTVTEKEFQDAPMALRKFDANDDELVTPGELVAKAVYPGTAGTTRLTPPTSKPTHAPQFPVLVLPTDPADTHWTVEMLRRKDGNKDSSLDAKESGFDAATFAALDRDGNGALTAAELAAWRNQPADVTWHIPLGTRKPGAEGASGKKGHVRLDLRADDGRMSEQVAAARKRFLAQFADTDADRDGHVTAEEAAKLKPSPLVPVLAVADRDGDGRLSQQELIGWLDLQDSFANAHALVTVLDHGAGLFEVLDADHDGTLSHRELRGAWGQMHAAGCTADGAFDRTKLPRQFLAIVSRGQPTSPLGRTPRSGPTWFHAMDRNGDGDVSRREFTGPASVFDRLDWDGDGLLSAKEAARTETKK